jgi:hypothetical protein
MEEQRINPSTVKGWGIDADAENDPTYPISKRTDAAQHHSWARPAQQALATEVLRSIERPNVTAVFGTSVPPSGLSGILRRFAFRFSESSYAHWLPLVVADRIGVFEGMLRDLTKSKMPNVLAERGWRAEWCYNRASLLVRLALLVALFVGLAGVIGAKLASDEE